MSWLRWGKTFSSHHRATSGNESSRSVSPVGAQSTTTTSKASLVVVALELEQAEELVHPGRHGELLGRDAVHAALDEQPASQSRTRDQLALELLLGGDLLRPQPVADGDGAGPRSASSASARQWAGSVDRTMVRRPSAAHRRAVAAATEVLPTPPLPV